MGKFNWRAMHKVQDDIEAIVAYFVTASQLVDALIQDGIKMPFCYDTLIVAKKSVDGSGPMAVEFSDDDSDGDDDEDEKEDDRPKKDYFAQIPQRLTANGCAFVHATLKGNARGARFMMQRFKDLKEKV